MGEKRGEAFRVGLDRPVKLEIRAAHVTSDAGPLSFRELDDALGLTQYTGESLGDTRTGQNTRHGLIAQLRQSVYGRLAGCEDTHDAEQLRDDPAMRYVVGDRARFGATASTSQMGRSETEILTQGGNLKTLMTIGTNLTWASNPAIGSNRGTCVTARRSPSGKCRFGIYEWDK